MPREINVTVTMTDLGTFRRLVSFLEDVENLADDRIDVELQDMVRTTREDLARIVEGNDV
jgi:hypothetical protein